MDRREFDNRWEKHQDFLEIQNELNEEEDQDE